MPGEPTFRIVRYSQVATAAGRDLILDEAPAVYAWYRVLSLGSATASPEQFLAAIDRLFAANLSDKFEGRLGFLYQVSVQESPGDLGPRSRAILELIAADADARERLARVLELSTFLQAPLYVGKASSLRRRIGEHVTGASGLSDRLASCGLPLSGCVLRYSYVTASDLGTLLSPLASEGEPDALAEQLAFLIEELLTRLSPSSFVRRPG